jgi:hypothetical protein
VKLYIAGRVDPWAMWGNHIIKIHMKIGNKEQVELVHDPWVADSILMDFYAPENSDFVTWDKKIYDNIFVFMREYFGKDQLKTLDNLALNCKQLVILVESNIILEEMKMDGCTANIKLWNRPAAALVEDTKEYSAWMGKDVEKIKMMKYKKSEDFVLICNASSYEENVAQVVKSFLHVSNEESEDDNFYGVRNLRIFSATDLPFEPFNNVMFEGLQSNYVLRKAIKNAKLVISTYTGEFGISTQIINAIILGTPVLMKDSKINRGFFYSLPNECFFSLEEELLDRIREYAEMDINSPRFNYLSNMKRIWTPEANQLLPKASYNALMKIIYEESK